MNFASSLADSPVSTGGSLRRSFRQCLFVHLRHWRESEAQRLLLLLPQTPLANQKDGSPPPANIRNTRHTIDSL